MKCGNLVTFLFEILTFEKIFAMQNFDRGKELEGLPILRTEKRTPKGGLLPVKMVSCSTSIVVKESPDLDLCGSIVDSGW